MDATRRRINGNNGDPDLPDAESTRDLSARPMRRRAEILR
jgi:hypothetical protein